MSMNKKKYDVYYLGLARAVRERAKCRGRSVGSVLVKDDRLIASGFNGTPSGFQNCTDGGCHRCAHPEQYPAGRDYDLCLCVHAESNCLLMAARFGVAVDGATCYTTLQPCFGCLKELIQAGIKRVVYDYESLVEDNRDPLWRSYWSLANTIEFEQMSWDDN